VELMLAEVKRAEDESIATVDMMSQNLNVQVRIFKNIYMCLP
jgi:hypothetical protein